MQSLDLQNNSVRARSTGLDSNPIGPDAGHIARDVLAVLRPDQEQSVRDQKGIEAQLSEMIVALRDSGFTEKRFCDRDAQHEV